MLVTFAEVEIRVFEATVEDAEFNEPGWYWQDCRMAECGPFASLADTLADMTQWINKHYP
jgi:hypothetical protein